MSTTPPLPGRPSNLEKKTRAASSIVTRNGARKAKIQTRARTAGNVKPSASVVTGKRKAQQKKKNTIETVLKDHYQITMESKTKIKGPTGFVTEPRMTEHRCLWDENYPENPQRLISVLNRCQELNLIEECKEICPRAASKDKILELHDVSVYEMMEKTHKNNDVKYLEEISSYYDAIYLHPSTHELALLSAGSTIELVDRVMNGEVQNGAAFVRPPGHHAMRAEPCGYCIYNNVALAARHAIEKHNVNRILIVDWDVHHGQATQQMFYSDPRVVYFSIHRYEHGSFWPNLRQSNFDYIGSGAGEGFNFNLPLNHIGMKDADYLAIWYQLLLPMAFEFAPQLILVSAGYDAAIGDEKGEMEITPACYATLTHLLMGVCSRVCVVLEGGYCPRSLAEGAALTLRTLLGHPPPMGETLTEATDSIRDSILNCIYAHRNHWRCFNFQPTYSLYSDIKNISDVDKVKHTVVVKWEGDETRPDRFPTRDCYPLQSDDTKRRINERLNELEMTTDLRIAQYPVCYVYDKAMLKHSNICEPGHVECPLRIMRIHERHMDFGLLDRMHLVTARKATDEDILAVHSEKHLNRLKELSSLKLRELHNEKNIYDSVYFHPDSLESARTAAGCVLQMVDTVLSGTGGSGVCVIRPPGHHANDSTPCGFCLLNNVAIAAEYAVAKCNVRRVLILDWDVHHGNGTQSITYDNDQILYISIHRYDNGAFFPNSKDAEEGAVGTGRGEGYNVNIPWNKRGMGDAEYMAAFTQIVLPIAREYNPDLVLVSAGFDACMGDPLGGCNVTPECYGLMTHMLRSLAGGRVILCLEGGYNVTSISYAMVMCTKALLGDPTNLYYDPKLTCHQSAIESINSVLKVHKKYWKSLKFQLALPVENVLENVPNKMKETVSRDTSLEDGLSNLSLHSKCSDGIHCGTDDELDGAGNSSKNAGSPTADSEGSSEKKVGETPDTEPRTLVDFLSENIQAIADGEMFAVVPLPGCPHLDTLYAIPGDVKFEQGVQCIDCDHIAENWVCLQCYVTACGRHINGHMGAHYRATNHPLSLSLADLSVWCYPCDAYIDNPLLYDAKNNAHKCKFGEEMPWCYRDVPLPLSYWILVFLRFALTLLPQTGYIHPDEYFQNVEVIAGDTFDVDVARTWEFDPKFPIRNMFIPKLILGPPLQIIRILNPFIKRYLKIDLRSPYFLLVIPRLFICLLSLINDYCLYQLCPYYGYLTLADVESLQISWNNWVVTPLNFLRYNIDLGNLTEHGIHPRWLHIAVNVPLLFNVLGFLAACAVILNIYRFIRGQYSKMPRIQSIRGLMLLSSIVPVAVLSLFPHQEARFIIPILVPLVYLYGNSIHIFDADDMDLKTLKKFLITIWYGLNILFTIFFGFIHQGGIYPFVNDLYHEIKGNYGSHMHVITTHSYSIPTYLLQLESTTRIWQDRTTRHSFTVAPSTFLHKYGSLPMDQLFMNVDEILTNAEMRYHKYKKNYKLYIVSPCSLEDKIYEEAKNYHYIDVIEQNVYYPHFCTEAFPSFPAYNDQNCVNSRFITNSQPQDLTLETVRSAIDASLKVVQTYKWLLDLYVVDFFVDNHWDMLPTSWQDSFYNIDPKTLGHILMDLPTSHMLPLSFLALLTVIKTLCLPRQGTYKKLEEKSMLSDTPKFKNLFLKHVKLKKRHEINLMASVVQDVASKTGCDAVLDFGSGLGHLVRMLSYKYGLRTVGIECQNQLTDEARKLDLELEYTVKKYCDNKIVSKLPRPVHCNEMLASADQLEKLSILATLNYHGLIGLHPCGDLGPLLLKYFVQTGQAKFICLVGCCYMKLNKGYPMSEYLKRFDNKLSYPAREIACHAIEVYCDKLCKGDYNDLKVHAFRAALESMLVEHDPKLRHSPIRSVKHTDNMAFVSYCAIALERLAVPKMDTSKSGNLAHENWKRVVVLYTLRLALAPLVETLILLDRLYYMLEHDIHCEIQPVFDANISPRNHVMIGRKK
ncbi:unnamed protein product [Leptosia nina]|uniref:Protein deacetylase HDAC6 n=1 Tax=Leptosia nina TaxID=320188 RepID=A0AAV1ISW6_9NEOP